MILHHSSWCSTIRPKIHWTKTCVRSASNTNCYSCCCCFCSIENVQKKAEEEITANVSLNRSNQKNVNQMGTIATDYHQRSMVFHSFVGLRCQRQCPIRSNILLCQLKSNPFQTLNMPMHSCDACSSLTICKCFAMKTFCSFFFILQGKTPHKSCDVQYTLVVHTTLPVPEFKWSRLLAFAMTIFSGQPNQAVSHRIHVNWSRISGNR